MTGIPLFILASLSAIDRYIEDGTHHASAGAGQQDRGSLPSLGPRFAGAGSGFAGCEGMRGLCCRRARSSTLIERDLTVQICFLLASLRIPMFGG